MLSAIADTAILISEQFLHTTTTTWTNRESILSSYINSLSDAGILLLQYLHQLVTHKLEGLPLVLTTCLLYTTFPLPFPVIKLFAFFSKWFSTCFTITPMAYLISLSPMSVPLLYHQCNDTKRWYSTLNHHLNIGIVELVTSKFWTFNAFDAVV